VNTDPNAALVGRLCRYDELVEIGVGNRPGVAAGLADRGCRVTATDIRDRPVPDTVEFIRDDVTDPDPTVYRGVDAVYALNCPPELQRPLVDAATAADAACLCTTLGGDPVVVDAASETLSGGTLFRLNTSGPTA